MLRESENYLLKRNQILANEEEMFLGADLKSSFTTNEIAVNQILLKEKERELTCAYKNSATFLPSVHFFQAKEGIEKSEIFSIIRKLPKGASLHTHLIAAVSADFLITDVSYRDNLYGGFVNGVFKLKFLSYSGQDDRCQWTEIKEMRKMQTAPVFDKWLKQQLTLNVNSPKETYQNTEEVWKKFKNIFTTTYDLFSYKPVFQDCIYQLLQELYDDNIMYTELKGTITPFYELDGSHCSSNVEFFETFIEVVNNFKATHPNFVGVGYIHSVYRGVNSETLQSSLKEIIEMKKLFPDFIIGFDFVGFEEEGRPLVDFTPEILDAQKYLKFFFHAGESNWFGHTDLNLADAVLFNSFRIGHGYSIVKHPILFSLAKERNIPLEICPISNQVLMLNDDPRNHPATCLMAKSYPVVICNDDPAAWSASGLSYDWYIAFMAMTLKTSGIEVLKQFSLNSIRFSALENHLKEKMIVEWEKQWSECMLKLLQPNQY